MEAVCRGWRLCSGSVAFLSAPAGRLLRSRSSGAAQVNLPLVSRERASPPINSDGALLQIFTAERSQNSISGTNNINGLTYVPGTLLVDTLGTNQALEVLIRVALLETRGLRSGLGLQIIAAGAWRAALPVGQIGIRAAAAGTHGCAIDRFLKAGR